MAKVVERIGISGLDMAYILKEISLSKEMVGIYQGNPLRYITVLADSTDKTIGTQLRIENSDEIKFTPAQDRVFLKALQEIIAKVSDPGYKGI